MIPDTPSNRQTLLYCLSDGPLSPEKLRDQWCSMGNEGTTDGVLLLAARMAIDGAVVFAAGRMCLAGRT